MSRRCACEMDEVDSFLWTTREGNEDDEEQDIRFRDRPLRLVNSFFCRLSLGADLTKGLMNLICRREKTTTTVERKRASRRTDIGEEKSLWFQMNDHSTDFIVRIEEIFQTKKSYCTHVTIITPEDIDLQFSSLDQCSTDYRREQDLRSYSIKFNRMTLIPSLLATRFKTSFNGTNIIDS